MYEQLTDVGKMKRYFDYLSSCKQVPPTSPYNKNNNNNKKQKTNNNENKIQTTIHTTDSAYHRKEYSSLPQVLDCDRHEARCELPSIRTSVHTYTKERESGSESEKQREIERDPNRYARYRHVIEILEYLITVWTHAPHQPSTTLTSILLATKWPKDTEVPPPLPPFLTLSQSPKDS